MKVYAKSEEQYLKTNLLFGESGGPLYYDAERTKQVSGEDAFRMYITGTMLIFDDVGMYGWMRPSGMTTPDSKKASAIYATFTNEDGDSFAYNYVFE